MAGLPSRLGFGTTAEEIPEILQGDSPALQGADLAVAYFSLRVGGDFHDFLRVSPQRFLFGLLDVAGKRETSGPVLEAAQACFRSSGEEGFAAPELNESDLGEPAAFSFWIARRRRQTRNQRPRAGSRAGLFPLVGRGDFRCARIERIRSG